MKISPATNVMQVKEESEKSGLKLNIHGEGSGRDFIFLGSKSLRTVTAAMTLKDTCSVEEKL